MYKYAIIIYSIFEVVFIKGIRVTVVISMSSSLKYFVLYSCGVKRTANAQCKKLTFVKW